MMDFGGRTEAFRALVGSHNYNLNTETSDKDYKVFVLPTFDDLYFNNQFSKSYVGESEDHDCHDIRKCSSLWYKANVNFLEVLFSDEIIINPELNERSKELISEIFDMKHDIARMHLSYLYDACIGMCHNKLKIMVKGTEGTKDLVEKYGFDTKCGMHALRIMIFLERFCKSDFNDFKGSIKFNEGEARDRFLSIKDGKITKEELEVLADYSICKADELLKPKYKLHPINTEANEKLINIIKELVKINL